MARTYAVRCSHFNLEDTSSFLHTVNRARPRQTWCCSGGSACSCFSTVCGWDVGGGGHMSPDDFYVKPTQWTWRQATYLLINHPGFNRTCLAFSLPPFLEEFVSPACLSLPFSLSLFLACAQLSGSSFCVYLFIQSSCTVCMHKFSPRGARAAQQSVAANHTGRRAGAVGVQIRGLEHFLKANLNMVALILWHPVRRYQSSLSYQWLVTSNVPTVTFSFRPISSEWRAKHLRVTPK